MRIYFLRKLPTLYWWGVRVEEASLDQFAVTIPFRWRTQNPFRSIYFAALAGTAEFSTGLPTLMAIAESGKSVSMLVTAMEAEFVKKADRRVTFVCEEVEAIREAVGRAVASGEGVNVRVLTTGFKSDGAVVARFWLTWSLKVRTRG